MKDIFICSSPKQRGLQQQRQYFSYFICWSRRSIPGGDCRRDFTGGHRLYVQRGSVLGKLWTDGRGQDCCFCSIFESTGTKKLRRLGICVLTFGVLLLSVFGVDRWDSSKYRSAEWKEYQEFNQLRSELLDYGFQIYDSNQEIYEELGISREAYELYKSWNFNDTEKFDTEVMKKLVDLKQKRPLTIRTVTAFLRRFPSDLLRMPMFYFFAVFAVLWLLCGKKRCLFYNFSTGRMSDACGGIFLSVLSGTDMVNRVDVGLWFSACLVMLWIFFIWRSQIYEYKGIGAVVYDLCGAGTVHDV